MSYITARVLDHIRGVTINEMVQYGGPFDLYVYAFERHFYQLFHMITFCPLLF